MQLSPGLGRNGRSLRIEHHGADRRPVSSGASPSLRVRTACALIEPVTTRQDFLLTAEVTLIGRNVSDRAVAMLSVVPVDEVRNPALRRVDVSERQMRIRRGMFQGSEERLGVRIVVRDVRTAEGWDDAEPLESRDHGVGTHRFAVVGVQHESARIDIAISASLQDELSGDIRRVTFCDPPADDAPTPDVHRQVQM